MLRTLISPVEQNREMGVNKGSQHDLLGALLCGFLALSVQNDALFMHSSDHLVIHSTVTDGTLGACPARGTQW